VKEIPAAAIAPAITADHCTIDVPSPSFTAPGGTPVALILSQPEERQDRDDDDDESNQINDAVHGGSRYYMPGGNGPRPQWFPWRLFGAR
jgi:hypothetical protein